MMLDMHVGPTHMQCRREMHAPLRRGTLPCSILLCTMHVQQLLVQKGCFYCSMVSGAASHLRFLVKDTSGNNHGDAHSMMSVINLTEHIMRGEYILVFRHSGCAWAATFYGLRQTQALSRISWLLFSRLVHCTYRV